MDEQPIMAILLALIAGGMGTSIVQAVINRKKNMVDISDVNVKTALSLSDTMEKRLDKIQHEIDLVRGYLKVCTDILDELNASYPSFIEYEQSIKQTKGQGQ
jgi:hypothetical protein